jgi:polysaccharide biosynthesis/export protein
MRALEIDSHMVGVRRLLASSFLVFGAALGLAGCASAGNFVWYSQLPPQTAASQNEYLIASGDMLAMKVIGHEDMTVRERVRPDGRIAIPIVGEVEARGKHPGALRAELEARLKEYLVSPTVVLTVEEVQPILVSVLGEVTRPGAYPITADAGLAQVLALGGGLTDFASRDSIYVVRQLPTPARIRFTFREVSREDGAAAFRLHPGDLVVVE